MGSKPIPGGFNIPTNPPAVVTVEEIPVTSIKAVEMLQRGHGLNTPGWGRAKRLADDWDPAMVGFLTLVELQPDTPVDILSTNGTMVHNGKGELFMHCADGFTRATAQAMIDDTSEMLAVVYRFVTIPSWERQCKYAAERFYERNSLPKPVRSADKLRVEYEMKLDHAIRVVEAARKVGIVMPWDMYHLEKPEKTALTKGGYVLGATGSLVNIFNKMASGAIDPDKAQNDLETVLKVNDALWPVDKMRDFHGIDMRSRWQGDFLMALFRILQTNPWMAGMILNPTTSAEKRVQRSLLADFWTQSVAGGMAGPKGFSNHANREASNDSRTMAVSEYRRSYYVAKAVVRTVNHGRRSHRLLAPLPMAGDEAFIIEDYDDE